MWAEVLPCRSDNPLGSAWPLQAEIACTGAAGSAPLRALPAGFSLSAGPAMLRAAPFPRRDHSPVLEQTSQPAAGNQSGWCPDGRLSDTAQQSPLFRVP